LPALKYLSADKIHNGHEWLPQGSIIAVAADGTIKEIIPAGAAGELPVTHIEGILCPGFVNAHCHIELSHMKDVIDEGNGLVPFLQSVMLGRNNFSEEDKKEAIQSALLEMEANGIVAVGDIANGTDTLSFRENAGLHIHTFVESIGFTETNVEDRFAWPKNVFQKFSQQQSERFHLRQSIVPHAPYSVSKTMFDLINNFEPGSLLTIHNEETQAENDFYARKKGKMFELYETLKIDTAFFQPTGKTSLQTYLPWLSENHPLILVHNTFSNEEDISLLKESGKQIFLCLCPNANWYIERRMPPVDLFIQSGLPICLGTDSLASNHELSVWSEIQTLSTHFPELDLATLLTWATSNGAKALQMDDIAGSLEPGKKPGIINITPHQKIVKIF
jgi:aminodeoxyfutalosine deaminase